VVVTCGRRSCSRSRRTSADSGGVSHSFRSPPSADARVVMSSSSAFAHGVRPAPDAVHVSYCYSPFATSGTSVTEPSVVCLPWCGRRPARCWARCASGTSGRQPVSPASSERFFSSQFRKRFVAAVSDITAEAAHNQNASTATPGRLRSPQRSEVQPTAAVGVLRIPGGSIARSRNRA
jgi:hypothetical protein